MTTVSCIDSTQHILEVTRVYNGWMIQAYSMGHFRRGEAALGTYVARTPKELADLVADWATRQQDAEKSS